MGLVEFITRAVSIPISALGGVFSHHPSLEVLNTSLEVTPPTETPWPPWPSHPRGCPGPYNPKLRPEDCQYPGLQRKGFHGCHTRKNRGCWQSTHNKKWDINTNYEDKYPVGITREYWIIVNETLDLSPDGQKKIGGVTFNGTYPGPLIEACWGDLIKVHVRNNYKPNGTTIHWHGIRQLHSNEMDGVNGVTQCPIAQDQVFTYEFRAQQYGHTWYHSHYSLQYPDGVAGPLIIHGPTSANWDIDNGPILISDWIHDTAFHEYECEAYLDTFPHCKNGNAPPKSDNIVVNGIGTFKQSNGSFTNNYFRTTFIPGKKHLLRLINGSTASSFVFSIDNHILTVVESDLVPIKPYQTDSLLIAIGQRYAVIVHANQKLANYWIRTTPAAGCNAFRTDNITGNFTQIKETTALVIYKGSPLLPFGGAYSLKQPNISNECIDESMKSPQVLVPVVEFNITPAENRITPFTAALEAKVNPFLYPKLPYAHWTLASENLTSPLWLDFKRPTILRPKETPKNSQIVRFDQSKGFVYMVLDGTFLKPNSDFIQIPAAHPIHLHGTDFVILGQSTTKWDPELSPRTYNTNNPPRRDVAFLPAGGYLAIAFKPDNPGAWLMHCHIAWHASSGLALQIVIRPDDMPGFNGDLSRIVKGCKEWKAFDRVEMVEQTDSGI
ncbi:putative laccase precursor [Podospora fimiseda]|uniref:Laccase n=1 Tax=Podospora fimiseda TaxID=252190 RepID=A0AAN7BZ37_9PEZI|nr:putative laccase precursor [Podospora fimiseda]